MLIGLTEINQLQASTDLGGHFVVYLKLGKKTFQVGLKPESELLIDNKESTEDKLYTTEPSLGTDSTSD